MDIRLLYRNDVEYRARLSGSEARANVQFFTKVDRIFTSKAWQELCAYEEKVSL